MSQYFGRATVYVNSRVLNTLPGASMDPGGVERAVVTNEHSIGWVEKNLASTVKCEVSLGPDTSLEELAGIVEATIVFVTDNQHSYSLSGCFLTKPPAITAGDGGKIPLEFMGDPAVEV